MTLPKSPHCSRREDQSRRTLARTLRLAYPPVEEPGDADRFEGLLARIAEDDTDAKPQRPDDDT